VIKMSGIALVGKALEEEGGGGCGGRHLILKKTKENKSRI